MDYSLSEGKMRNVNRNFENQICDFPNWNFGFSGRKKQNSNQHLRFSNKKKGNSDRNLSFSDFRPKNLMALDQKFLRLLIHAQSRCKQRSRTLQVLAGLPDKLGIDFGQCCPYPHPQSRSIFFRGRRSFAAPPGSNKPKSSHQCFLATLCYRFATR